MTRTTKGLLWAAGSIAALAVVGLFVADIVGQVKGCGSVDPTDPNNYSSVTVRNDTSRLVTLTDCRGGYCSGDVRLPRNRTVVVRAACGVSGDELTSWRVLDSNGRSLGYIAVHTPKSGDLTLNLSTAITDARTRASVPAQSR